MIRTLQALAGTSPRCRLDYAWVLDAATCKYPHNAWKGVTRSARGLPADATKHFIGKDGGNLCRFKGFTGRFWAFVTTEVVAPWSTFMLHSRGVDFIFIYFLSVHPVLTSMEKEFYMVLDPLERVLMVLRFAEWTEVKVLVFHPLPLKILTSIIFESRAPIGEAICMLLFWRHFLLLVLMDLAPIGVSYILDLFLIYCIGFYWVIEHLPCVTENKRGHIAPRFLVISWPPPL